MHDDKISLKSGRHVLRMETYQIMVNYAYTCTLLR